MYLNLFASCMSYCIKVYIGWGFDVPSLNSFPEGVFKLYPGPPTLQPDPLVHLWHRSLPPHLCFSGNGQEGRGNTLGALMLVHQMLCFFSTCLISYIYAKGHLNLN